MRRICTFTPDIERRANEFQDLVYAYRAPYDKIQLRGEPENALAILEREDMEDEATGEDESEDDLEGDF